MSVGAAGEFKYFAFISYSHKDKEAAQRLHRELETYRVPRRLVGRETPLGSVGARLYPIFRDTDELPTSADLSTNIKDALARSRHLIVVCSPHAAASRWVDEEIRHFKRLGRENRILALIVDGEPNASDRPVDAAAECFPRSLRYAFGPEGEPTDQRTEPLAADIRPNQDGRGSAKLKLVAGLTGLPFNELRRRDHQRAVRRRIQAAAAALAVLVGVGAVWFQGYRERRAQAWEEARQQAVLIAQVAQSQARAWNNRAAAELALRALPQKEDATDRPFTREALAALHRALALDAQVRRLRGHAGTVLSVGFSPDGKRLVTGSGDKTARVWDLETGKTLFVLLGHEDIVTTATFSPDGSKILTSGDRHGYLWDAATGERLALLVGHTRSVQRSAFSPDGRLVATAGWDDTVGLWDTASGRLLRMLVGGVREREGRAGDPMMNAVIGFQARVFGSMGQIAFSPEGRLIATAGAGDPDAAIRVWDTATGERVATLRGHDIGAGSAIDHVAFAPDGVRLVSASRDRTARLWNIVTGVEMVVLRGHAGAVSWAEFSPDGMRVVTASDDGTARLWDGVTGEPLATLSGHSAGILQAAFSPDGRRIATISSDNTVRVWEGATGRPLAVLTGHGSLVTALAFSQDGRRLATTSRDNTAIVWDATVRMHAVELVPPPESAGTGLDRNIAQAFFSQDGSRVVTAITGGTARLWDTASSGHLALLIPERVLNPVVAFDATGRTLLVKRSDGDPELWDTWRSRRIAILSGAEAPIIGTALGDDGKLVATVAGDGRVRVWEVATGRVSATFTAELPLGERPMSYVVRFVPGRPLLAVTGCGQTCRVVHWHTEQRRIVAAIAAALEPHSGAGIAYFFSGQRMLVTERTGKLRLLATEDGRTIAEWEAVKESALTPRSQMIDPAGRLLAISEVNADLITVTTTLWDAWTGTVRAKFDGAALAFSPDGALIAAATADGLAFYDTQRGVRRTMVPVRAGRVVFALDNRRVVILLATQATLVDVDRGGVLAELREMKEPDISDLNLQQRMAIEISPDQKWIALIGNDGRARVVAAEDGHEIGVFGPAAADWARFVPQTSRLAVADRRGVSLWDVGKRSQVALLRAGIESESGFDSWSDRDKKLFFLKDGRTLLVATNLRSALFDAGSGKPLDPWWRGDPRRLALSPDRRRLYLEVSGEDLDERFGEIWDVATRSRVARFDLSRESSTAALGVAPPLFSGDGRRLVAFANESVVIDTAEARIIARLDGQKAPPAAAAFTRDGRRLATSAAEDKIVQIWNAETGAKEFVLEGFAGAVKALEFSADGDHLLVRDAGDTASVWHLAGRKRIFSSRFKMRDARFNESGTHFFIVGDLSLAPALWRMPGVRGDSIPAGNSHLVRLTLHTDAVEHATFSPDGARLLTAARDGSAQIHDTGTGKLIVALRGHAGAVKHAAFSPDGTRVATASEDKTVRLWEVATGSEISMFNGMRGAASAVEFSPDGADIAIFSAEEPLRIWHVSPPHWPAINGMSDLIRYARDLLHPPARTAEAASAPVHECDRLAGDPYSKGKLAPGVRWDRFDPTPALGACRAAMADYPGVARFRFLYARSLLKAGVYHLAMPLLEALAEQEVPEALTALGLMYASGLGIERNGFRAAQLYERAAKAGDVNGQHNLAHALLYGLGVARDDARGLALLRRLAESGVPNSQFLLGSLHRDGHAVAKAPALAREWLEKAAAQDYADADYLLALIHWVGEGVEKDQAKALAHLRRAAVRGSLAALYELGLLHFQGKALERDPVKGVYYVEQAAARGHAGAQLTLARALAQGLGIPRNAEKAYFWLVLAARSSADAEKERDETAAALSEETRRAVASAAWRWRARP